MSKLPSPGPVQRIIHAELNLTVESGEPDPQYRVWIAYDRFDIPDDDPRLLALIAEYSAFAEKYVALTEQET